MRSHGARFLVLLVILPLANCSSIFGPDDVDIRIRNGSGYDFESVLVGFPNQAAEYGAVRAGKSTGYRTVGEAYRYAYVEVVAAGRTLIGQPIDYVGEELLEPGRYTYELSVRTDPWEVWLDFVRE